MEWVLIIAGGAILGVIIQQVMNAVNTPSSTVETNRPVTKRDWEASSKDDIEKFNFRKTRWGMSVAEVQATEHQETIPLDNPSGVNLIYDVTIDTYTATLIYSFQNDALTQATYSFSMEYADADMYMIAFDTITGRITERYGKPWANIWDWINQQYEFQKEMYGIALTLGHVSRHCVWETMRTKVTASHMMDNSERLLLVTYFDREWEAGQFESKQAMAMDNPF